MYRAYGLLKPDTDFNMHAAFDRLKERFSNAQVTRSDERIFITRGEWDIEVTLATGAYVPTETQGITDKIAGLDQTEVDQYLLSDRRVEVSSETPDPFMEHFNDFLLVVEVLKSFSGLLAVDPHQRAVL